MGKNLAEIILSNKSGGDAVAGDIVVASVDLAFVQDTTGPLTVNQFRAAGFTKTAESVKAALFLDHAAPSPNSNLSNDHITLRTFAEETGSLLSDVGDGVCHQVVAEALAKPGDLIVGADSHTVTAGGLGTFAAAWVRMMLQSLSASENQGLGSGNYQSKRYRLVRPGSQCQGFDTPPYRPDWR
jgi:3-isopropylmalate/(R)-2-methylmalate dehydratase large subunit